MVEAGGANRFVVEMGAGHSVGFADLRQAMALVRFVQRRKLGCRLWMIEAEARRPSEGMQLVTVFEGDDVTVEPKARPADISALWVSGTLHEKS